MRRVFWRGSPRCGVRNGTRDICIGVQEGADIDLYYEDPYARANVELFFYSHYTVPLDALDVRSARKAAKRFAAGC